MILFPAIDIKDGKVVRLRQGNYADMKIYDVDPIDVAKSYKEAGAEWMHVVDLDGAKTGKAMNYGIITNIVKEVGINVEVGGGIRDLERIRNYLNAGAKRVILGTVAIENPDFTKLVLKDYSDYVAIGVDANNGKVAIHGWNLVTDMESEDFCSRLADDGCKYIIYTDISKDGLLQGTNLEVYSRLSKIKNINITASGGISSIKELKILKDYDIYGAIIGKALYENKIDLKEALEAIK